MMVLIQDIKMLGDAVKPGNIPNKIFFRILKTQLGNEVEILFVSSVFVLKKLYFYFCRKVFK